MNERPVDIGAVKVGWPSPEAGSGYHGMQISQGFGNGVDLLAVPRRDSYGVLSMGSGENEVALIGDRWAPSSRNSDSPLDEMLGSRRASDQAEFLNLSARPAQDPQRNAWQTQADSFGVSDVRHLINAGWASDNFPLTKDLSQDDKKDKTVELVQNMSSDLRNDHWVASDRLIGYLSHRVFIMQQRRQLPLAVCFFVVFVLLMTQHFDLHTKQQLSGAVEESMGLKEPVPTGFSAVWEQVGRRAEFALAVPHTRVLGGVRLARLLESETKPSEVLCSHKLHNFIGDALNGDVSSRPSICHNRSSEFAWIHWSLQPVDAQVALTETRSKWEGAAPWSRLAAQFAGPSGLAVQSISLNDKVHAYTLYNHAVHFDISGFMIHETQVYSFDARPPWLNVSKDSKPLLVLDAVFCALLAIFACLALCGCCLDCRAMGCRATLKSGCNAWLLVALLMICMGLMMVSSYAYCNFLVKGLNKLVGELPAVDMQQRYNQSGLESLVSSGISAYEQQLNALLEQAQRVHLAQMDLRYYTAVAMICVCLRLLRALHATAWRLDFLMSRISRAAEDLAHLVLVLCTGLLVFLLAGHLIFGGRVEVFSNGGRALESTVLFLFGFMFDSVHKNIQNFGGGLGVAWVWLFNILMVLLMLNVGLVMVLHAYVGEEAARSKFASLFREAHSWISDQAVEELAPSSLDFDDDRSSAAKAVKKYSEKRVYQELIKRGAHLLPRLSSTSVAVMLGAKPGVEWRRIDRLVMRAAGSDASPSLLSSSVRLGSRLDANVQELGSHVAALALAAQASEASGFTENVVEWKEPPVLDLSALGLDDFASRPVPEPPQALALGPIDSLPQYCSECGSILAPDEVYCRKCLVRRAEAVQSTEPEVTLRPPAPAQPLSMLPFAPNDDEIEEVLALGPPQAERRERKYSIGSEDEDEMLGALSLPDDVEPPVISKIVWTRTLPLVSAIDALGERRINDLSESVHALERNFNPVLAQALHDPHPHEIPSQSMHQFHQVEDGIAQLEDLVTDFANKI
mmetsp:Transcript_49405/g.92382  ORF Transcript_49405/g.92382 Transcript_49405/m.92382 type:complete len:1025 (-) Transcript_49405:79-3153(-)